MKEIVKEHDQEESTFIGVAWPYVNGELHIGHLAGYLLPADIFARYCRSVGKNVLMVSGSDCFGTPITIEADKRKLTPQKVVNEYHAKNVHLFKDVLNLSYDIYTKTEDENHIAAVQDFFLKLLADGYIYVDTTQQYYSASENKFLPDRYVEGTCKNCGYTEARSDQCDVCGKVLEQGDLENPISKLTKSPVELKDTEHYFLDWPKLQPAIEKYVDRHGKYWKNWVYQETLGWLKQGIKPRAISRDIDWGVPLPIDRMPREVVIENADRKRLYVWFEAVIGYFSASKLWSLQTGKSWEEFWKNANSKHYYFMGKDNLPFHTMFWPGELIAYDSKLHLPDFQSVNMFLNFDGKQFSKSRGVSISIEDIVTQYGNDPVRFYLTLIMPEYKDSSFNWSEFKAKNNEILVANLGNLIHRTLSIGKETDIKKIIDNQVLDETSKQIEDTFKKSRESLDKCEFRSYLDSILKLSGYANKYFDYEKLWILKKENPERFSLVIKQLYLIILSLGILSSPLMPETSEKIFSLFGLKYDASWPDKREQIHYVDNLLSESHPSIQPVPIFKKIEID